MPSKIGAVREKNKTKTELGLKRGKEELYPTEGPELLPEESSYCMGNRRRLRTTEKVLTK